MRKRLRKKKHLGEFKEFGWYVDYQSESVDQETESQLWDLLIDKVESLGLMIGGSTTSFFASLEERAQKAVVQDRRQQLHEWLTQQAGVTEVNSSPLTDAWYGPFQD